MKDIGKKRQERAKKTRIQTIKRRERLRKESKEKKEQDRLTRLTRHKQQPIRKDIVDLYREEPEEQMHFRGRWHEGSDLTHEKPIEVNQECLENNLRKLEEIKASFVKENTDAI